MTPLIDSTGHTDTYRTLGERPPAETKRTHKESAPFASELGCKLPTDYSSKRKTVSERKVFPLTVSEQCVAVPTTAH